MDHFKLITLIIENPQLWNHTHDQFRNQHLKLTTWETIAHSMGTSVLVCKESFKALREKYIRERTKTQQSPDCRKWELFDALTFLEPHIVPRRQPGSNDAVFYCENDAQSTSSDKISAEMHCPNFCKDLITLVFNCRPLWDRENKDNHDKQLKLRLWNTVAKTLKTDVNTCMLKWKGLREKYIRQRQKYTEGKDKWEFLDSLSFLDNVIHYRRKQWQLDDSYSFTDSQIDQLSSDCETLEPEKIIIHNNDSLHANIKTEYVASDLHPTHFNNCAPDSTLEVSQKLDNCRKRAASEASDSGCRKKDKHEQNKTPEQIFGELVTSLLSTKNEADKNAAMLQIMHILTKNN